MVIDRQRPGNGYRHLLTQDDVRRFISIIPNWAEHSRGLNAVVLAPGIRDAFGHYSPGVISIFAWYLDDSSGPITVDEPYYKKRTWLLECLSVSCLPEGNGDWALQFDENKRVPTCYLVHFCTSWDTTTIT